MQRILSDKDEFNNVAHCGICKGSLINDKVRDHCHFTGKYRGAAHYIYNLQFKKPKFAPVIFHNLAGYDSHLFVKALGKTEGNISVFQIMRKSTPASAKISMLALSSTKKVKKLTLRISFALSTASSLRLLLLDKLVCNLRLDRLKETEKVYKYKIELVSRKGVYPYDYMDSITKFDETELPPKKALYSKLNDYNMSDEY